MIDVLFWDDRGGFGPDFNRAHAVGGAEIHLVQVAEYIASTGRNTVVVTHQDRPDHVEKGVMYIDSRLSREYIIEPARVAIVVGCASLPPVPCDHLYAFQVVDPRPHPDLFRHLKGRATMVCVSEWQAQLFRDLGHVAMVIPVPIPDAWYTERAAAKIADFGCFSSWNKGASETLLRWDSKMGSLAIGSAYSHPENAAELCAAHGAFWMGTLRPSHVWRRAMMGVRAIARVCTIGETFGVVDVAARALGIPCYTLCTGDVGSLREVGADPFLDEGEWRIAIKQRRPHPGGDAERFRASRVLPLWSQLVERR